MSWLYHSDLLLLIIGKIVSFPKEKLVWNTRCSFMDLNDYSVITRFILFLLTKFSNHIGYIVFNSYEGRRYHKSIGYNNKNMIVIPNGFNLNKLKNNIIKNKYF